MVTESARAGRSYVLSKKRYRYRGYTVLADRVQIWLSKVRFRYFFCSGRNVAQALSCSSERVLCTLQCAWSFGQKPALRACLGPLGQGLRALQEAEAGVFRLIAQFLV